MSQLTRGTAAALGRAHALLTHAAHRLTVTGDAGHAVASLEAAAVAAALEECGADPDPDLLAQTLAGSPRDLVAAAAASLDAIPVPERPVRLGVVRVHLTGLQRHLPADLARE